MSKFEIYRDNASYYRWRLIASNGEIVASSEGYSAKSHAILSAQKVEAWAKGARIIDLA